MKKGNIRVVIAFLIVTNIFFQGVNIAFAAYQLPIGISAPPFGINEAAPLPPSKWPVSEARGYYYIDSTHPAGTDTSNPYGYPNKPRLTIPTTYSAGSYVEIHGGPYTTPRQLIITANGTAGNPIWIRGSSPKTKPIIRRQIIIKGSYVIFEHLYSDMDKGGTIEIRPHNGSNAHHIVVRHCEFVGSGTPGWGNVISIYGATANLFHDAVIYNNLIHKRGSNEGPKENDYHGVKPTFYSYNVWILNNQIYNMGGDSVQVGDAALTDEARPHHIYIGGNTFYGNFEDGVDVKRANHVVISQNLIHSMNAGSGIVFHNGPTYVWALYNRVYDMKTVGIATTGSINTYFIGNVVQNIHHRSFPWNPGSPYCSGAAIHMRNSQTVWVVNNTLWDYDVGIQGPSIARGHGYHLYNNIVGGRTESTANDIHFPTSPVANNSQMDCNLLYCPDGAAKIIWGSNTPRSLMEFKSKVSKGLNCPKESNPMFVSTQSGDFRIQSSSPAYNAGFAHEVYKTFQNRYGIDISKDIQGIPRPQGGKWDIGAYEFTTVSDLPETLQKR